MDGDLTEQNRPQGKQWESIGELFNEVFPMYLNMGMTAEGFWEQDPSLCIAYRKAYETRIEQEREMINYSAWLQGKYIYDALCAVHPLYHTFAKRGTKAAPYYEKPIKFYKSEEEMREDRIKELREKTAKFFLAMMGEEGDNGE